MSDFKIIGNSNPVIGVIEFYSVSDFYQEVLPNQNFSHSGNAFEEAVQWEVHVFELGEWRKAKGNEKRGNKVTFKFRYKSLSREGLRIIARKGDKKAILNIEPQRGETAKIDDIELLDKAGKKITERLSYGQTVKARVHCLHMEKRKIFVTLWEDDAKGAGHNKANENNLIATRSGIVRKGKADIDFLLTPSFAKNATRGSSEDNGIHEYYVTAEYNHQLVPSNKVNIKGEEDPILPFKGRTAPRYSAPHAPAPHPRTEAPVQHAPAQHPRGTTPAPHAPVKPKINRVSITDMAGNAIRGIYKQTQLKVWINTTGLVGREIRLKLYDEDPICNDLLFTHDYTITADLCTITAPLSKIPRSLGGTWGEGDEQELFAEVEVLQKDPFRKSTVVDVNIKGFKTDPVEVTNSVFKVDMPEKEEKKENKNKPNKYRWAHSEFGNLIAKHESSDNYNICNQTKGGLKVIDNLKIVNLTIKEIQVKQENRDIFAVGRYQLIPKTLNSAVTTLNLDVNQKLNEDMQDKIFDEYLIKHKRPKIIDYLEGDGEVEDAMYASALEWASIGVEKGKSISDKKIKEGEKIIVIKRFANGGESYYAGDGLNKAHISPEEIKKTLINSKNANK